jgi:serine/threonine-protein kinase
LTLEQAEAGPTNRLGQTLGEWQLKRLIGEGGAGSVYEAVNGAGVPAAIKLLHAELAEDAGVRARFQREALVATSIDHAGVVGVMEHGETPDGVPYVVMELLEGETVEARRSRKGGALSVHEVLWIADQTLSVLSAAHKKGVVHRDVKPENIFLTHDRKLKLLDFGIARLVDLPMTRAGAVLGTLSYMAPEQATGKPKDVDVQTDLWAVGATMFTLLSGRLVREDGDVPTLLRQVGAEVVSLATVAPALPRELTDLVDFALQLDKTVRWPSAKAMRRAVRLVHATLMGRSRTRGVDDDVTIEAPSWDRTSLVETMEPPAISIRVPAALERVSSPDPVGMMATIIDSEQISTRTRSAVVIASPPARRSPWPIWLAVAVVLVAVVAATVSVCR